jgi:non-canonical (house-cleaning) NTP pyrophosphatase
MQSDLRHFWQRLQTGVSVAVAAPTPEKLLGVRDGFQRYFREGLDRDVPVAVVAQPESEAAHGLPVSDREVMTLAGRQVARLAERLGDAYHFYVASEGGIHAVELDGGVQRYFVRNWTLVRAPVGEAWGASGSGQLPDRLVTGLDDTQVPFAVPGTRRAGGMISSLTGGLENRRRATSLSTLHALSSLFYGMLESRPTRRPA